MKNICILLMLMTFVFSCKTLKNEVEPVETQALMAQPSKSEAFPNNDTAPRDLNELIKEMALTEDEKAQFLSFYKDAATEMSKVPSEVVDKKDERQRRASIRKTRDDSVRSILETEQIRMYNNYIKVVNKRMKTNRGQGAKSNK